MKKILKLSLFLVVALTTMSSYAIEGDFLLNVKNGEGKVIAFSINNINKVDVSIYDNENNLIYSESATGKNGIKRNYNLKEFPEGTYYLEVENNLKKVRYEIVVIANWVEISTKAVAEVYKTSIIGKPQKLVLK